MLRVVGGPRDLDTRIENRIGEPAANPYLYFASQIYCGLDGIERKLVLPRATDTPYETKADRCRARSTRRSSTCAPTRRCATASAPPSSTTTAASRKPRSPASISK